MYYLVGVILLILISIKQINQYEKGVKFSLGKYSGLMEPGWRLVLPIFQSYRKVDIRVKAVDVPDQEGITKDNVSTKINAVIYYKVKDAAKAILEVENFYQAVAQLAQTTMRDVIGSVTLDELLSQREKIALQIESIIDKDSDPWGIDVQMVALKDIILPPTMVRTMAKQAEAEREKRATIINSEGEVLAANNLAKAAGIMNVVPGALHLRSLNSINDISSDDSNTVVFVVPLETLKSYEGFKDLVGAKALVDKMINKDEKKNK